MNGVSIGQTGNDVTLARALLVYEGQNGAEYATVHPVTTEVKSGRPLIGAGRPLDRRAMLDALVQLDRNAAPAAEFLPATVLGVTSTAVTWWCPPVSRRVFFKCPKVGERSAVVTHPGLVFQAGVEGFRVFALAGDTRPEEATALFEPPYFNTWDHGQICIGSAKVPGRIEVAAIKGWEEGFFNSAFTHPNHGGKRVNYDAGFHAFWTDMLDGRFEAFPLDVLVPMKGATAGKLVAGKIGGAA
ncbi:PRTRC genetic system protein B [Paraburkholderia bannensis]|uniref:PRTRC genetic system protein B n=1 Tax=Paraburkholderia bannensis TaxID=765414 RepID=A0A7W9U3P9_9BURK|nr:PRTRC system protein B [Paraburkholderia bannensis]MBB6106471.1 PRTRC genetic system protein B [Paraburkholderia bannensis]